MHEFYPSVTLVPLNALVYLQSTIVGSSRSMALACEIAADQDVLDESGRSLRRTEWSLSLVEEYVMPTEEMDAKAIGVLSFFPGSTRVSEPTAAMCYARVAVRPDVFVPLLNFYQASLLPKLITISVGKLKYGHDPDGMEMIWNTTENPHVSVREMSILWPTISVGRLNK